MDEKDIENKLRKAWNSQLPKQPDEQKEASWKEFAAQAFPARERRSRKWLYAAAATLALAITAGIVLLLDNTADRNDRLAYSTIENNTENIKRFFLPDSSLVELGPGSTIRYTNNFLESREISLSGQAFFNVRKNKMHPFRVSCQATVTTVLGTSFTIEGNTERAVQVSLYEGRVQMNVKDSDDNWILSPGDQFTYSNRAVVIRTFDRFKDFDDAKLISVLDYITATYGYRIEMPEEFLKKRITLRINKREPLTNIVGIVAQMCDLNPSVNDELKKITFR